MIEVDLDRSQEDLVAAVRSLRAENSALQRSEALLRAALDGIPDPVFVKDERGCYLVANTATSRMMGRDAAEVVGLYDVDVFSPEAARRIGEADRRVMAEGRPSMERAELKSASVAQIYETHRSPCRDERGRVTGVVGISRDITELAREGGDGAGQHEALRTIFDHIPAMICQVGPEGEIRLVNHEWERVLGGLPDGSRSGNLDVEGGDNPQHGRIVRDCILEPGPAWKEFRARAADGRNIDTAWANALLPDGTSVGLGLDITEPKRAVEELSAMERQFRGVFEGTLDAIVLADDEGRYVDANPVACDLFGLPRDQLLGKSIAEFAQPGFDLLVAWTEYRRRGAEHGTFRLIRPDGKTLDVEYAAKANVLPGRHLSALRDVTERRQVEEALHASERRVVSILESISDAFYSLDRNWCFQYVNRNAEWHLGRSAGDLLGRNLWQEFPQAIGTNYEHHFRRAAAERVQVTFEEFYPPLGRWFEVHIYPSADEGLSVYFTDMTAQRRIVMALKHSDLQFRLVLENSRDVIYKFDLATQRYDYISPSGRDVMGLDIREVTAGGLAAFHSLVHPEDLPRLESLATMLRSAGPGFDFHTSIEYRIQVPGKGWRWMSNSLTVIRDAKDFPTSVVGNVRDVTEERWSSERLRDASRRLIRAQEEGRRHIARELHDEIGQALTAVLLNLRGALRGRISPEVERRLEESSALIEQTIGQVRDISLDLRPSMLDDLGLVDALRSHVAKFAQRAEIDARFVADEAASGRLDQEVETACYRIAQEALTNVARHSGAGHVRVELSLDGGELRLTVSDDGVGFDVAEASGRASLGSSLGILSMQERAALLGGHVDISSMPGRGAEVRAHFSLGESGPEFGTPPGGV